MMRNLITATMLLLVIGTAQAQEPTLPDLFIAKSTVSLQGKGAPAPAIQKVLILEAWMYRTDDHCKSFGIQYGDAGWDKMTEIFHSVGLRRADFEPPFKIAKGETADQYHYDEVLNHWLTVVSDTIQRQLVFNSTPNERAVGEMHDSDRKAFCDKMWKDYGPNSPLPLLEKVNGPPLRPDTYRHQGGGVRDDFERRQQEELDRRNRELSK